MSENSTPTQKQTLLASMAEWSKAVDLRPTIVRCEGSNPSACN
jgi:hypothetical protein